jgi:hypothetical protein
MVIFYYKNDAGTKTWSQRVIAGVAEIGDAAGTAFRFSLTDQGLMECRPDTIQLELRQPDDHMPQRSQAKPSPTVVSEYLIDYVKEY